MEKETKKNETEAAYMYRVMQDSSAYRWFRARQREVALNLGIEVSEEDSQKKDKKEKKNKDKDKDKEKKNKEKGILSGLIRYWRRIRMGSGMQVCITCKSVWAVPSLPRIDAADMCLRFVAA